MNEAVTKPVFPIEAIFLTLQHSPSLVHLSIEVKVYFINVKFS